MGCAHLTKETAGCLANIPMNQIANAFKNPIVRDHLVQPFVDLIKDPEAEVRTAAASQISGKSLLSEKGGNGINQPL